MPSLPAKVRIYLTVTVSAAALLLVWCFRMAMEQGPRSGSYAVTAIIFLLAIALSGRYTLRLAPRTTVDIGTTLELGILLLVPVPVAVLVVFLGILIGRVLSHRDWFEVLFNASSHAAVAFVAGEAYLWAGGRVPVPSQINSPSLFFPLLVLIAVHWVLGLMVVSGIVSIQTNQPYLPITRQMWEDAAMEHVALYLMGILTALTVQENLWTLFLLVVPLSVVYISLRNSLRLRQLTRGAVEKMADIIDRRDPYTYGHSQRVAALAERIAQEMRLPWEEVERIKAAARVHDLGKIAMDRTVLEKKDILSDEEWRRMQEHPTLGAEILQNFPDFQDGTDYVRYHHERWDGRGYPAGLRGEQIPLGARIIAVADSYDAMSIARPYRVALPEGKVRAIFLDGAGKQWDPAVVEALFRVLEWDTAPLHVSLSKRGKKGQPRPVMVGAGRGNAASN